MPKLLLGCALALVLGCTTIAQAPTTITASVVQSRESREALLGAARAAAVVLRSTGGGGSGVCVFQDHRLALVMTAAHVVENDGEISIGVETGRVYPGKVIYQDDVADLAVVETAPVFGAIAKVLQADEGYRFAPVLVYGFPALVGPEGHPTFGVVASEKDQLVSCAGHTPEGDCIEVMVPAWRITAPIFFGNSGGAVYVWDGGWMLAGVAQRVAGRPGAWALHVGYCSPAQATRGALNAALYVMEESPRVGK